MSFTHFIELLLVAGVIIAVGIPLFGKLPQTRPFSEIDPIEEKFKHLLVRKEEVLLSIKELEIDLKTDKISNEDYEISRKRLEREALATLEQIDRLEKDRKKSGKSSAKNLLLA